MLRCKEPVEVRCVLKLALDATERPELKDFRLFMSGEALDDGGVDILRGIIEGEWELDRSSVGSGEGFANCCTGAGRGCGGAMDMRFALFVSVGEIVLAPSPENWAPGRTEALLADVGVPLFLGDFGNRFDVRLWSGVRRTGSVAAEGKLADILGRGCTDLAFAALVLEKALVVVSGAGPLPLRISRDERTASPFCLSCALDMTLGRLF